MKAVNTEQLLQDYEVIAAEQEARLAEIERQALAFANARGYTAEKAEEFIKYVQHAENDGLTEQEKAVLNVLGKYIYEEADEPETAQAVYSESVGEAEADNGEVAD